MEFAWLVLAALAANPAAAQDADSLNPMHALDRAALKGFVELPLFDPARQLPPPPPPAQVFAAVPVPPPPLEPPPNLQLVGILHGKRDIAIVHKDGAEKTLILRNGATLGNWTVVVHPLGVTLHNGDRSVDFAMFAKNGVAARPAPSAPFALGQMMRRQRDE